MSTVICPPVNHHENRGTAYIAVSWALNTLSAAAVISRLYSRAFLTRSLGSDDLTIAVAFVLITIASVVDTLLHEKGFGRHCVFLSSEELGQAEKWIYISWLISYTTYFFIRASVMLFTLRLLPRTKKRSQWIIYFAFLLNFAISLIATVSCGIQCRPFSALWNPKPGHKCLSPVVLSATNKVNGILACVIDITTACIPAFLLWKVQMKRTTKLTLDTIFALGVVTAALSIARAATITQTTLNNDITWRIVIPLYFGLLESKLGVTLACAPALRQMIAYCLRTGSCLPTDTRQPPNSDFDTMRHRVNVRDWFRRGKRDPMRAQGLLNATKRSEGLTSSEEDKSHGGRYGLTDPEDSPLSELQERITHGVSQV